MPLYEYNCLVHGSQEVMQGMSAIHTAKCSQCGKLMVRVYSIPNVRTQKAKRGKDRVELFNNLASEGHMSKDWKSVDSYYQNAIGATNGI